MTSAEIKQKYLEICLKYNKVQLRDVVSLTDTVDSYVEIFQEFPNQYIFHRDLDVDECMRRFEAKYDCFFPFLIKVETEKDGEYVWEDSYGTYAIFDHCIVELTNGYTCIYTTLPIEEMEDCMVALQEEHACRVFWVTKGQRGFNATKLTLKPAMFDITTHYNDDLDYLRINKFINGDSAGIMLLHGIPATGKSYFLRNLAQSNPKICFYFMDRSTFEYLGDASFMEFLEDIENSVIILEDCEALLKDRTQGNYFLSTILNLADGIIGDGLKLKFLCTYNANDNMIDKAVLRKGRLKYKYEFKALSPEKTAALAKELGKKIPAGVSLPVGEIYNYDEEINIQPEHKIGFGK